MKKSVTVLLSATMLAWGSFIPQFGGGNGKDDPNFVRDAKENTVRDIRGGKLYTDIPNARKYTFHEATEYCKGLRHGGYSDWRLPSLEELKSLFDFTRRPVSIRNSFHNTQKGIYWTSTPDRYENAWYIDYDLGRYNTEKYDRPFHAMCVRDAASK